MKKMITIFVITTILSMFFIPINASSSNVENNISSVTIFETDNEFCGWEQWGANSFWDAINSTDGGHSTRIDTEFEVVPAGVDGWTNATWFAIMRGFMCFNTSGIPEGEIISVTLHMKSYTPHWASLSKPSGDLNIYSRPSSETTFNWTEMYNNYTHEGILATTDVLEDNTWYNISISPDSLGNGDFTEEYLGEEYEGDGIDTIFYLTSTTETIYPILLDAETGIFHSIGEDVPYLEIIVDSEAPEIVDVLITPNPPVQNQTTNFTVVINDTGTITNVSINITGISNYSFSQGSNDTWYLEINLTELGDFNYTVWVTDESGYITQYDGNFTVVEPLPFLLVFLLGFFVFFIWLLIIKLILDTMKKSFNKELK